MNATYRHPRGLGRRLRQAVSLLLAVTYVAPILVLLAGQAPGPAGDAQLLSDLRASICSHLQPGPGDDQGQRDRDSTKGSCILCHLPGLSAPDGAACLAVRQIVWNGPRLLPPADLTPSRDRVDTRVAPPRAPPHLSA